MMVKRTSLLLLLAILAACSPAGDDAAVSVSVPTVWAGGESLQGVVLEETSGLTAFRGIPFAAPPTGELRWKPPQAHTPRPGTQIADTFGAACPQLQGNHDWYRQVATLLGNPPETIGPLENIDEDCLTLNVWTKYAGQAATRPVMVWIYGGANMNGYSHEPNYLGTGLAPRGVVFVSLNYRVGVMGFMGHPGLSEESPLGVSGNYGILDQVAALQWVQENIAAFGGDPENVTIFGESAGAANAATLAASPLAKGLFHRVISQSGAYNLGSTMTQADAEAVGMKVGEQLEIDATTDGREAIEKLRQLDWQTVVSEAVGAGRYSSAVIDGHVLPDAVGRIYLAGEQNPIDLLIGANAHEYFMYQPEDMSREQAEAEIDDLGEPWSSEVRTLLADELEADHRLAADRVSGGAYFLCPSLMMADAVSASGGRTWFYHFTRIRPNGDKVLAYHGAEIPYALDTADDWLPADEIDAQLTDAMAQYWVNFATKGSPDGPGLLRWPEYTAGDGRYLELGDEIRAGENLDAELCAILERRIRTRLDE